MKISVIGTGYVGLVSGTCFAEFGWDVVCIDKSEERIGALLKGQIPIYEPGLDEMVRRNAEAGKLAFSMDYAPHIEESDAVFIAVGTPSRRGDGHADLSYVFAAAKELASHLRKYTVIVDKSTVPVGTAGKVAQVIREENPDADFDVASNPEFLREGSAIDDFLKPDRVVIGTESSRARAVMRTIYAPLADTGTTVFMTNTETAELIKYASNAFLAAKISFINEISALCEKTGADVLDVAKGMGFDSRIGSKFLQAGPGYGGSCFPKDVSALIRIFRDNGLKSEILEAVTAVNHGQKLRMAQKIKDTLGGDLKGKKIGILGLTFKPETDDMRESPSLVIIPELLKDGAEITACDPEGLREAEKLLGSSIKYSTDPYETADGADALVLLTEWKQFCSLDIARIRQLMRGNVFADLRNVYCRNTLEKGGFTYLAVGR